MNCRPRGLLEVLGHPCIPVPSTGLPSASGSLKMGPPSTKGQRHQVRVFRVAAFAGPVG